METQPVNGSNDLLHYLPLFKVVVCKACGFAIQPNAISGHLKEKHKLYRLKRRALLNEIARLPVVDAAQVAKQDYLPVPVPHLPVLEGFVCSFLDCKFLSISSKRMRQHCSNTHGKSCGHKDLTSAKMQTLFKGNHLRYFKVSDTIADKSPNKVTLPGRPKDRKLLGSKAEAWTGFSGYTAGVSLISPRTIISSHPEINMSDLSLLHHYLSTTSLTLWRGGPIDYFTHTVPQMARESTFLMQILLATAAVHLTASCLGAENSDSRDRYMRLADTYQARSLPFYRLAVANADQQKLPFIIAYSKALMVLTGANLQLTNRHLLVDSETKPSHDEDPTAWDHLIANLKLTRTNTHMAFALLQKFGNGKLSWVMPKERLSSAETQSYEPAIKSLQESIASSVEDLDVKSILLYTCKILKNAFKAATYKETFGQWDALLVWTSAMSTDFVTLVEKKQSHALAIMAHYCVLLKNLRSFWWMTDHDRILLRIVSNQSPDVRRISQWPWEQIEDEEC